MTLLYFNVDNDDNTTTQYSVFLDLEWLDEYALNTRFGDAENFLRHYNSDDVLDVINALDAEGEPYTIQEEHYFSAFMK